MESDQFSEHALPSDVNAEKSVLGAVTLNNDLIAQALDLLNAADFHLDSHRKIFDAMVSLRQSGNPIDAVTLPRLLEDRAELEQVGGVTYLASLIDGVPQTDDIEHHCRIIKHKARERQAITLLNLGVTKLAEGKEGLDTILHGLQSGLAKISASGGNKKAITGVYVTLDALFNAQIEEPEQILFGLHRGEVAGLFAVTNYGKTTLLYNTAFSIAAGETLLPLAPIVPKPRRVLYVDSESPASVSKADLQRMISGVADDKAACKNFTMLVDTFIKDSPLSLSNPDHFKWLIAFAKIRKADLVVIDTAASAFELQDENNNAEVTRKVMNPLKQLAREVNCAVILTHHIGKSNETQSAEAAYKGRGASAFGALSRTVFNIEKDAKKGPGYVVVSCPKIKGQPFEPVLLKLDFDTRWFEKCDDSPTPKPEPPSAQEIADFVKEKSEARTEEIKNQFASRASARTISERIAEAEQLGLIMKPNKQAPWRMCNPENDQSPIEAEVVEESTDDENVQCATPIRDCTFAHSGANGGRKDRSDAGCCPNCNTEGIRLSDCLKCGEFIR